MEKKKQKEKDKRLGILKKCPRCKEEINVTVEGVCVKCAKKIAETFNSIYFFDNVKENNVCGCGGKILPVCEDCGAEH